MGSNWPSNEGSYNQDTGFRPRVLPLRWRLRHASFIFCIKFHVRRETWALCVGIAWMAETRVSSSASWPLHWSKDAIFDSRVLILQWCWDATLMLRVLVMPWCWDAGFNPRVLVLCEWQWLVLHLEFGLYFLMTCLQWFLDSLQIWLESCSTAVLDSAWRILWFDQIFYIPLHIHLFLVSRGTLKGRLWGLVEKIVLIIGKIGLMIGRIWS